MNESITSYSKITTIRYVPTTKLAGTITLRYSPREPDWWAICGNTLTLKEVKP